MGCHLIALGGAGQKTLEMLTYACACDTLYTLDDDLRRVPLDTLHVLTADTDATPAAEAAERYQALQTVFSAALPHAGFHTKLTHTHLPVVSEARPGALDIAAERDALLLQSLFTPETLALDARAGLTEHADLGMFFFADALSSLAETLSQGEEHPFFDRIQRELDQGEDVQVFLAASAYGGTGASGLISLARFLRGRFASPRLRLGAALLLPPHDPRNADRYNARAQAALRSYGEGALMRHNPYDEDGLLDALYLVRTAENLYAMNYAQAAAGTQDDMRLQHLLAARCASVFYATAFGGEDTQALGLYHIPRASHQPSWASFDGDRAYFRIRLGGLMRAAALHLAESGPQLTAALRGKARPPRYMPPYFKPVRKYAAQELDALHAVLQELSRFLAQFVRRMAQVQRVLPPPAPGKAEPESFFDPRALDALQTLLTHPEASPAADALRKQVLAALPLLVYGGEDGSFAPKRLLPRLGRGGKPAADTPAAACAAYAAALLDAASQSTAGLDAAQLPLPDSRGTDPNHRLVSLARSLPLSQDAPYADPPEILAWETRLCHLLSLPYPQSVKQPEVVRWRGLLAVLLLWDGWELRHTLPALHCAPPPEGAGTRAVLAALPQSALREGLSLFTLQKNVDGMLFEGPLGLLSTQTALLPAADPQKLYGLLPSCVHWYDSDTRAFSDPCPFLSEADRTRLIHRLQCLLLLTERAELQSPLLRSGGALQIAAEAFLGDLQNRHDFWREKFEQGDPKAAGALYIRTLAVFGPAIDGVTVQEDALSLHDLKQNPLMQRLLGAPDGAGRGAFTGETVVSYLYRGVPFAVSSPRYLLAPANVEGEPETLQALAAAIDEMASPAYHRQAAKRFLELANRLTSRPGASKKAVSLLRAWSVRHSRQTP